MKSVGNFLYESLLFSDKDMMLDADFSKNIIFITGLSGAGKSTFAEDFLQKYNYDAHVILDNFWYELYGNKYDNIKDGELDQKIYDKYIKELFKFIKSFENKKERYVIEGIQIFTLYFDIGKKYMDFIKNYPIIFINSSVAKSGFRGLKRYWKNNKYWLKDPKNPFLHYSVKNYNLDKYFEEFKKERFKFAKTLHIREPK